LQDFASRRDGFRTRSRADDAFNRADKNKHALRRIVLALVSLLVGVLPFTMARSAGAVEAPAHLATVTPARQSQVVEIQVTSQGCSTRVLDGPIWDQPVPGAAATYVYVHADDLQAAYAELCNETHYR
jgi:hypothetical protein